MSKLELPRQLYERRVNRLAFDQSAAIGAWIHIEQPRTTQAGDDRARTKDREVDDVQQYCRLDASRSVHDGEPGPPDLPHGLDQRIE